MIISTIILYSSFTLKIKYWYLYKLFFLDDTNLVSEAEIVKELSYCFQGLPGSVIKLDHTGGFTIDPQVFIYLFFHTLSLRKLVHLLFFCCMFLRYHQLLKCWEISWNLLSKTSSYCRLCINRKITWSHYSLYLLITVWFPIKLFKSCFFYFNSIS